jgi:hypothetical protein
MKKLIFILGLVAFIFMSAPTKASHSPPGDTDVLSFISQDDVSVNSFDQSFAAMQYNVVNEESTEYFVFEKSTILQVKIEAVEFNYFHPPDDTKIEGDSYNFISNSDYRLLLPLRFY